MADSLGWYFTDAMVQDLGRDVVRLSDLEEKVAILKELLALKDRKAAEDSVWIDDLYRRLDEAKELSKPSFWESIPPVVWVSVGVALAYPLRN